MLKAAGEAVAIPFRRLYNIMVRVVFTKAQEIEAKFINGSVPYVTKHIADFF